MSKCKKCIHYKVCYELTWHEPNGDIAGHLACKLFDEEKTEEKPKTQFDLIKNMNIDEFATFLVDIAQKSIQRVSDGTANEFVIDKERTNELIEQIKDFLKKET